MILDRYSMKVLRMLYKHTFEPVSVDLMITELKLDPYDGRTHFPSVQSINYLKDQGLVADYIDRDKQFLGYTITKAGIIAYENNRSDTADRWITRVIAIAALVVSIISLVAPN